jgi:hypothetical protein
VRAASMPVRGDHVGSSAELATLHTSWARRLRAGGDRPAWRVTFTRRPIGTVG